MVSNDLFASHLPHASRLMEERPKWIDSVCAAIRVKRHGHGGKSEYSGGLGHGSGVWV